MTDNTEIKRRTFVQAITAAASGAALSMALLPQRAAAQSADRASAPASDKYETAEITVDNSGEGLHKGHRHFIDMGLVADVEGNKVRLSAIGAVAVTLEDEK